MMQNWMKISWHRYGQLERLSVLFQRRRVIKEMADLSQKLYIEYRDPVFRYIMKRVQNRTIAEDLLSEVFLKVHSKLHTYDGRKASLSTWIYTIAHNTVCSYYRKAQLQELPLDEETIAGCTDPVEQALLQEMLAQALESLSQREQDIIVLYYYHDLPLKEIAEKVGISYANAKFIKSQAIKKLRSKLKN